ncbi:immunity 49 family protein [Amycolatopsis sp. H6(2020)]|nr:immunity 49 family protein [Amycolatopsis sp. H6(2020)]
MTTVSRHPIDQDVARKQVDALAPKIGFYIDYVETDPSALNNVLRRALTLTRYRSVVDPAAADPETWRDLRTAAEAGTAIFTAATGEGEVEAVVTRPMRFAATGPTSTADAGNWLTAAWLAVVDRNDDLIQRLCAVPLDLLLASGEYDAYMAPWLETVRNFLTRREIPAELFGAAMDGTDPDAVRNTPRRAMLQLIYPPIEMFYHLLRRDDEKFNASLARALEQHRSFWTSDEELVDDPDGFLALAPLAIAVLARSAGMNVDVESEYLPSNFLLGIRPPV